MSGENSDYYADMEAPECPSCGRPLEYLHKGVGLLIHGHIWDCVFNIEVGLIGRDAAFNRWKISGFKMTGGDK
ncbi:MAG TPA: hypothetical protein VFD09_07825 [Thiopseudomonas sp.]|nr:hypothetical protein [Thiopseudomonas sp.]